MIQGGGFTANEREATRPRFRQARNGLKNDAARGDARRGDPTLEGQFFINVVDNARLDYPNPDGNGTLFAASCRRH